MKKFLQLTAVLFVISCFVIACTQNKALSEADQKIIADLGFEPGLITELRNRTDSAFNLITSNLNGSVNFKDSMYYVKFAEKKLRGLTVEIDKDKAQRVVNQLKENYRSKGYFIYISEYNFGYEPDKITVLKTSDKFDLLRFEGTNGINYDLYVEDVIKKLIGIDQLYGLDFTAVGFDFIEADFQKLPDDIAKLANELYQFCPDIVDQGVGTVEELEKQIKNSRSLYLWWD